MSDEVQPVVSNTDLNRLLGITYPFENLDLADPDYTQNLNAYLHALKDNIERILSVPFLQGQAGESILATQFPLFEADFEPTDIGKEVLKALFPKAFENTEPASDWRDRVDYDVQEYAEIAGKHAYDNLEQNSSVTLYYKLIQSYAADNPNNREPLQSASYFVFYDARLEAISEGVDSSFVFEDTSAAIFRQLTDNGYSFVNANLLPTIYYSENSKGYCWSVNGIPTGISCEGVQGEPGKDGTTIMVKIEAPEPDESGNIDTNIVEVFDFNNKQWKPMPQAADLLTDEIGGIGVFDEGTETNPNNIYFGEIYKEAGTEDTWKFTTSVNMGIRSIVGTVTVKQIFDELGQPENLLGMYVKDADFASNNSCHVLYSDTPNTLSIAPMNYNDGPDPRGGVSQSNSLYIEYPTILLNSNSIIKNASSVSNYEPYLYMGSDYINIGKKNGRGVGSNINISQDIIAIQTSSNSDISISGGTISLDGGTISLSGITTVSGATTLNNTLTVSGATNLNDELNVSRATTLSTLTVGGSATFNKGITVSNEIGNALNVNGTAVIYGPTNLTSLTNPLTVSGPTILNNTLEVSRAATLTNTLTVYGTTTFGGDIMFSGNDNNITINDEKVTITGVVDFYRSTTHQKSSDGGYINIVKPIVSSTQISQIQLWYNNSWKPVNIDSSTGHLYISLS